MLAKLEANASTKQRNETNMKQAGICLSFHTYKQPIYLSINLSINQSDSDLMITMTRPQNV